MVYPDYKSYTDTYIDIILEYVLKHIYPIKEQYPIVLRWKLIGPLIKLIYNFKNTTYNEKSSEENILKVYGIFIIVQDDIAKYESEHNMLKSLISTLHIYQDELYELSNYIIANYKPFYEYEEAVCQITKILQHNVNTYIDSMNIYLNNDSLLSALMLKIIIEAMTTFKTEFWIADNVIYNVYLDLIQSNEDIEKLKYIAAKAIGCILKTFPSTRIKSNPPLYHNLYVIHSNVDIDKLYNDESHIINIYNNMLGKSKNLISYGYYEGLYLDYYMYNFYEIRLLKRYDSHFDIKPLLSSYSSIIDVLENTDERALHKCICKGIHDNEIEYKSYTVPIISWNIYIQNKAVRIMINTENYDMLSCLLLYYISKNIPLSILYNIERDTYYQVCEYILKENREYKNMMNRESIFIKKYFNYGELDIDKETILVNIIFPQISNSSGYTYVH